jgi:hypothetical protein
MGVFEKKNFANGTDAILKILINLKNSNPELITIACGGETVSAIENFDKFSTCVEVTEKEKKIKQKIEKVEENFSINFSYISSGFFFFLTVFI